MPERCIEVALCVLILFASVSCGEDEAVHPLEPNLNPPGEHFKNPLFERGADPSILVVNGEYHMVRSGSGNITVARSPTLTGLASADPVLVWQGGKDGSPCCNVWAPQLVKIAQRYYIYYAASNTPGNLQHQRSYVLAADAPLGPYTYLGQLTPEPDHYAIDSTVLELGDKLYWVWSGWQGDKPDVPPTQHLFIAPLANPWTVNGPRVLISSPDQDWERRGGLFINEGPEVLRRGNQIHVIYSASSSLSRFYCLGALTMSSNSDPLDPASWKKSDGCLFESNPEASVYAPGHNTFVLSPDGTQFWNVYHGNEGEFDSWGDRSIRMQQFGWHADDTPNLGHPVGFSTELARPAGETQQAPLRYEAEYGITERGISRFRRNASSGQVLELTASQSVRFEHVLRDAAGPHGVWLACASTGDEPGSVRVSTTDGASDTVCPRVHGDKRGLVWLNVPFRKGENGLELNVVRGSVAVDYIEPYAHYPRIQEHPEPEPTKPDGGTDLAACRTAIANFGLSSACADCACAVCPPPVEECAGNAGCTTLVSCSLASECTFCPVDADCLQQSCTFGDGLGAAVQLNLCACDNCALECFGEQPSAP